MRLPERNEPGDPGESGNKAGPSDANNKWTLTFG
jgi:hypothetical protein